MPWVPPGTAWVGLSAIAAMAFVTRRGGFDVAALYGGCWMICCMAVALSRGAGSPPLFAFLLAMAGFLPGVFSGLRVCRQHPSRLDMGVAATAAVIAAIITGVGWLTGWTAGDVGTVMLWVVAGTGVMHLAIRGVGLAEPVRVLRVGAFVGTGLAVTFVVICQVGSLLLPDSMARYFPVRELVAHPFPIVDESEMPPSVVPVQDARIQQGRDAAEGVLRAPITRFREGPQLLRCSIAPGMVQRGLGVSIGLVWQLMDSLDPDWEVDVHLRRLSYGGTLIRADHSFPAIENACRRHGTVVEYRVQALVPADADTGRYIVLVGLRRTTDEARLIPGAEGAVEAGRDLRQVEVGHVVVRGP